MTIGVAIKAGSYIICGGLLKLPLKQPQMTTLYIKNMVCDRCVMVVRSAVEQLGFNVEKVALGEVTINGKAPDELDLARIDQALIPLGFERIDDRKGRLVEAIKNKVIKLIHSETGQRKSNWSTVLAEELHYDYNYLSTLFSSLEGITLEQYIIRQKIERAKELLFYDELTLSQIADKLDYSSVAHLSAQFKKITGLTPSELKKSRSVESTRKPLDKV
jgi:AraC family transcriptional regulator